MSKNSELNILFLDIDGPIAPFCHREEDFTVPHIPCIMPAKIELFKKLLNKHPEFKIVIISDWRNTLTKEQLSETFNHFGISIHDVAPPDMEKDQAIELWVKDKLIKKSIIIDDDIIFDLEDDEKPFHQIKPSLHSGLLPLHLDMFDEIVNEE